VDLEKLNAALRRISAGALFLLLAVFAVVLVAVLVWRPKAREITLIDGTPIEYLGGAFGTNHWNPATPTLIRWIARWPAFATLVIPRLPKKARTVPHMAVVAPPWTSAPVLWFYSRDASCQQRRMVVRCFDLSGNEISSGYQLNFRPVNNAAPALLLGMGRDDYKRVRMIELYEREGPLPAGPFADLAPLGETFLGRIDLGESRSE
jgi:hypothetical protein